MSKLIEVVSNKGMVILNIDCIASVIKDNNSDRDRAKITLINDKVCEYADENNVLHLYQSYGAVVESIMNPIDSKDE